MTSRPVVLCVDDDPDILASVARILRQDGHDVVTVNRPSEAIETLSSRAIAVLVSDFEMPEMNGVQLAVRARDVQPETVRILLTGRNTVDTVTDGINVGEVYRFIAKPFDPLTLRREVASAIAHHQEIAMVSGERSKVVRRQLLTAALENDFPGITQVARDDSGAYVLSADLRQRPLGDGLAAVVALLRP